MARLRYNLKEAESIAVELADAFVAMQSWSAKVVLRGAVPSQRELQGRSSKHPTHWSVCYQLRTDPGTTIDGGEVFVEVDLETERVTLADD